MNFPIGLCFITFNVSYAELRAAAQQLDELDYDSVWVWDHYVSWNDAREPVLEGWSVLAGLAETTSRIRLGPLVANNTNRHPGRLAKVAATLQEMSGGRLELGIGAGGLEYEQRRFGIEQGSPAERVAALEEALQIIPALWSGEPQYFQGRFYQLEQATVTPPPQPRPRIVVGASGPRMCRLAGRYADELNLQWRNRADFARLFAATETGMADNHRARGEFAYSIHSSWQDLTGDPAAAIERWQQLGFSRAILYVAPPYPLDEFARIRELL